MLTVTNLLWNVAGPWYPKVWESLLEELLALQNTLESVPAVYFPIVNLEMFLLPPCYS